MKTTSLELSQRLKALGVPQVSEHYWCSEFQKNTSGSNGPSFFKKIVTLGSKSEYSENDRLFSSYSSDELGEWLKSYVDYKSHTWEASYNGTQYLCGNIILDEDGVMSSRQNFFGNTLAEAMGLMLEFLVINGYIKVEELK